MEFLDDIFCMVRLQSSTQKIQSNSSGYETKYNGQKRSVKCHLCKKQTRTIHSVEYNVLLWARKDLNFVFCCSTRFAGLELIKYIIALLNYINLLIPAILKD